MAIRPQFHNPRPRIRTADKAERDRFYGCMQWSRFRMLVLSIKPLCAKCGREARIVHHKIDRLERPDLAYDLENMESLCSPCHTRLHKKGI